MKIKEVLATIQEDHKNLTFITPKRIDHVDWSSGDETKYDNKEVDRITYKADGSMELTLA